MTPERRDQLILILAKPESERVERTQSVRDTDKFCEAICAFANDLTGSGEPGFLFIGADDAGRPTGATITDELLLNLASIRSDGNILPQPVMSVENLNVDDRNLAVVEVRPSDRPPVRYKGRVFVRVGPRRAVASAEEERRLAERAIDRTRTWDLQACADASVSDLSLDLFRLSYLPLAVSPDVLQQNRRSNEEQLAA